MMRRYRTRERWRGQIVAVLLVAVIALTLVFTMAAGSVSQLRITTHTGNATQAMNMAEAVCATAIAQLRADISYGREPQRVSSAALISFESGPAEARLSFRPDVARQQNPPIPVSLNNVGSDASAQGWRRVIPPESVQLIGVGRCNGVTRTVEMVLHVPAFPYIASSSGTFSSNPGGELILGVLPENINPMSFSPEQLLPGHLASNSRDSEAVNLQGKGTIFGDVEAMGGIVTGEVDIQGGIKPHSSQVPLPEFDLRSYDPGDHVDKIFTSGGSQTLAGYNKSPGPLTISGDLNLEAGVLYVNGDLVINGSLKGKGAVVATGSVTVNGVTQLEADQQVALLSGGDVTLKGSGSFRGMVYAEGTFHSDGAKLVGTLVQNSKNSGRSDAGVALSGSAMIVGDPTLSFDEGWLVEEFRGLWIDVEGDQGSRPRARQKGRFLETRDGEIVVEWSFEVLSPTGPWELDPPLVFESYYDQEGKWISSNWDDALARYRAEYPEGYIPGDSAQLTLRSKSGAIVKLLKPAETRPQISPDKVKVFSEMLHFKFNSSQFLRAEDRLRLILRREHSL